ncbi:energy transducer TonB [Polaribacter sp. BAL334]|uniref:M56 family metallopeptidase n=1 Tax=Polaribacter sp. BAL334 TaxID=1708178 RepID=UPI0018D237B0|nr:M56 family metallopeptidase [Polaribacter sp. BAL334]MBG7612732.1 energy transducer TonB [Polaribacter sp. BAL334]
MINYILQVVLYQVLFLAIYDFYLSKETFFTKNRWYLVFTPILSFLIPLIKIPSFQKTVSQEFMVVLPEIVLSPEKTIQRNFSETTLDVSINYVSLFFWMGVVLFSVLFLIKLVRIFMLIKKHETIQHAEFTLIFIPNQATAFSFFNYIFLGKDIPKDQHEKIIQHEKVHSQQKHSMDLLLFEILKIVMWFNPMIYVYQKRISLVHEYISDAIVAKSDTKELYINNLLSCLFQVENISFINQFHKPSYLKKRILMMTKKQSHKINQLKYLVLVPVLLSMLFYSACNERSIDNEVSSKKQLQTKYRNSFGKLVSFEGYEETYLDDYMGDTLPKEVKEISFHDLTSNEKEEFNNYLKREKEYYKNRPEILKNIHYKFFKMPTGRNAYGTIEKGMNFLGKNKKSNESNDISFLKIDKAPTFPGCDDGDKECFSKNIKKHFDSNFIIQNYPELESGKKRVFVGFKIDIEGNIQDIVVKAPHENIEKEVIRVISSLPKMTPGEHEGKKVAVKYSIPFVVNVL